MNSNFSILEIRKNKFIENPNHDNFLKLISKIDNHKEIFDNKYFIKAIEIFKKKKEIKGLIFLSQLYIHLERNIEAEHLLFQIYNIDNTNDKTIYYLFDILCRRKQLGFISSFGERLNVINDELLYIKSLLKYFLLTNKQNEIDNIITDNFEKYKTDSEFVLLIYKSAIQNDNHYCTYLISKTKFQYDLFKSITKSEEHKIKSHFYLIIYNLLQEYKNDIKNC